MSDYNECSGLMEIFDLASTCNNIKLMFHKKETSWNLGYHFNSSTQHDKNDKIKW